ncbi:hypothetical protein [Phenylobacterium sp.]|uniref:hypothetical protein n=1 Tax=Phenylobacterium sp. TaxID=1871053 RepID=UPI00121E53D2|nr:hypothetical protein [Phenylobacterium sp.]THD62007.1 MAG: hypothetical protein E8A49_08635 [Phenylobacterium sp.]
MWNSVQVSLGSAVHRGRYRMEGDQLVLEWRNGRVAERCGLLKPEYLAAARLKQLVSSQPLAA